MDSSFKRAGGGVNGRERASTLRDMTVGEPAFDLEEPNVSAVVFKDKTSQRSGGFVTNRN